MGRGAGGRGDSGRGCTIEYSPDDDDQPSLSVIKATAEVTGRDRRELKPLTRALNVEALDALFADTAEPVDFFRSSGMVVNPHPELSFTYEGCRVSIDPTRVTAERLD